MTTETIDKLFLELSQVTKAKTARELHLEDLLCSAHAIAARSGEGTAWPRFSAALNRAGISAITAKTFRILPGDDDDLDEPLGQACKLGDTDCESCS